MQRIFDLRVILVMYLDPIGRHRRKRTLLHRCTVYSMDDSSISSREESNEARGRLRQTALFSWSVLLRHGPLATSLHRLPHGRPYP